MFLADALGIVISVLTVALSLAKATVVQRFRSARPMRHQVAREDWSGTPTTSHGPVLTGHHQIAGMHQRSSLDGRQGGDVRTTRQSDRFLPGIDVERRDAGLLASTMSLASSSEGRHAHEPHGLTQFGTLQPASGAPDRRISVRSTGRQDHRVPVEIMHISSSLRNTATEPMFGTTANVAIRKVHACRQQEHHVDRPSVRVTFNQSHAQTRTAHTHLGRSASTATPPPD